MRAGAYCSTNLMNEDELWPTLCRRDRIRYARRPAQIEEERWHATATAFCWLAGVLGNERDAGERSDGRSTGGRLGTTT